jgi:hypothetical protein
MILNNINEAKQFLPSLNLTLENDRFKDFFRRAQEWLVSHIVGTDIEDVLETDISVGQEDIHADLRLLCQRVIAEKALLAAIPEMDMQLTEAGFAVQDNDDMSPASAQRVDRLLAKLPERIANDIDALVRFLLKNSNGTENDHKPYDNWRGTDQFKYLTGVFMPLFEEYKAYCHGLPRKDEAPMTYDDFYSIIPLMSRVLREEAGYHVSKAEIDRLLELYRDNSLLEIHRKAIVCLKDCAVAALRYDTKRARDAALQAREVMLSDPNSFPAFKASDAFNKPTVNLDGDKLVNML